MLTHVAFFHGRPFHIIRAYTNITMISKSAFCYSVTRHLSIRSISPISKVSTRELCKRRASKRPNPRMQASPPHKLDPPSLTLFYSDNYTFPLPPKHRFPMEKYALVRAKLEQNSTMANTTFKPAPLATRIELEQVHSRDYITRTLHGKLSRSEQRAIGLPWSLAGVRRALGSTGGTAAATREVLTNGGRLCGQTAGGTHHAKRGSGAGFCVFNDIGVAAMVGLREFGVGRVLVLDFDVHQGDGTARLFEGDERVFTISVHGEGNYPFEKASSDVDVGLGDEAGDAEMLSAVDGALEQGFGEGQFGLVMLQMGVDMLADDTLGRLRCSRAGLSRRNMKVFRAVLQSGVPGVVTMGGGYSRPIGKSVEAHCDVFVDAVHALAKW